jgi:hypothetical protein
MRGCEIYLVYMPTRTVPWCRTECRTTEVTLQYQPVLRANFRLQNDSMCPALLVTLMSSSRRVRPDGAERCERSRHQLFRTQSRCW